VPLSPKKSLSQLNYVGDHIHRNNNDDDDDLTITSHIKSLRLIEHTRAETKVLSSEGWMEHAMVMHQ
jgi:hypothetical protein